MKISALTDAELQTLYDRVCQERNIRIALDAKAYYQRELAACLEIEAAGLLPQPILHTTTSVRAEVRPMRSYGGAYITRTVSTVALDTEEIQAYEAEEKRRAALATEICKRHDVVAKPALLLGRP